MTDKRKRIAKTAGLVLLALAWFMGQPEIAEAARFSRSQVLAILQDLGLVDAAGVPTGVSSPTTGDLDISDGNVLGFLSGATTREIAVERAAAGTLKVSDPSNAAAAELELSNAAGTDSAHLRYSAADTLAIDADGAGTAGTLDLGAGKLALGSAVGSSDVEFARESAQSVTMTGTAGSGALILNMRPPVAAIQAKIKMGIGAGAITIRDGANSTPTLDVLNLAENATARVNMGDFQCFLGFSTVIAALDVDTQVYSLHKNVEFQWATGGPGQPLDAGITAVSSGVLASVQPQIADEEDHRSAWQSRLAYEAHTADDTLTRQETGSVHSTAGASATVTLTLPNNAVDGTCYTVVSVASDAARIDPQGTDAITYSGGTMAAGEYLQVTTGTLEVVYDNTNGLWVVLRETGTIVEETP